MKRGFCGLALCRFRREILPVFRSASTGKTQVLLYHIFSKKKSDFCGSAGNFFGAPPDSMGHGAGSCGSMAEETEASSEKGEIL